MSRRERGQEPEDAHRLSWLLLLLGIAACVWLVSRAEHPKRAPPHRAELTDAVPEGPALLLTLDVSRLGLREARKLLQSGGSSWLGLKERCGFEPLLGLRKIALAMPPSTPEQPPDFALIAETTLKSEPVLRCAEAVIRQRGGSPARSRLGAFESVRDRNKPIGEVAIRGDGLFVLSGGQYFRAVMDAASGVRASDEPARLRSAIHAKLRGKLGGSQLLLSALPETLLPLPGVQALGFGLKVERDAELRGALYCGSAAECQATGEWLERLLTGLATEPGLSSLAGLKLAQRDAELEVFGRLPTEQLGAALAQLLGP